MKIAIVSNLYPPIARGGAEQIAVRAAQELHVRGHEVVVVSTHKRRGGWLPRLVDANVESIYRFRPRNLYHVLDDHRYPFALRAVWHLVDMYGRHAERALGTVLDAERPDVVWSHNLKGFGMRAVAAIRARGIRHAHTLHDIQLAIPSGLLIYGQESAWLNRSFLQQWYERQMRAIVGSPAVVLSPSRFLADFYRDRGFFPNSQVEVLPNPAPNIQTPMNIPHPVGPLRILYAGQLETHKGIRFLLEALNASNLPFELHVAGEGTLSSYVTDWASRDARVTYHGFCSLDNLVKLFSISDAVLVPSLCYENSPTVIYEAFQSGVPVVASDIGGVGELVHDGQNGFLFAPGDREGLLRALRRLGDARGTFAQRRDEIRATIRDHSLERYVSRLVGFLAGS